MRHAICIALCLLSAPALAQTCPPAGWDEASLQALKASKFVLSDAAERRKLADGLLACLGDPDPELRDGIAYDALAQWLRAGDFDAAALRSQRDRLYAMLDGNDVQGFRGPFAALVLSEVARTDRIQPWMTPEERAAMVERAAAYLESIDDYRGYDATEGWRHGVAHGADWLMQLALNPALDRAQLERILAAVAVQAVPVDGPAYVFGEPARLAQPVLHAARRGLLSESDWQAWFAALSARLGKRGDGQLAWLARMHNLKAFLTHLYVETDRSDDVQVRALKPVVAGALK
ncbi:uncharacterized protein DUF2785 [Luteimonas cucumeris]|uniref:Uncharacterized protein DUF2785 n=1 Tax=Luteimonas cucumeris TaxID=985012 RepID=A0A562L098_9GAMM|nr:DUF2785 domain-containing protein [Luteimonas cucumeris]TWI01023.1 uncharacterized protein DUF2785 [Luteimonas cucumeris]